MGRRIKKKTNLYTTYDEYGEKHHIIEYTEYEAIRIKGDQNELTEVQKVYQTSKGHKVRRIDRMNFEILRRNPKTGENKIEVHI